MTDITAEAAKFPAKEPLKPDFDLYKDIADRTQGDLYIGVVGPVRTGKSTFITAFMEKLVMPLLPQSPRRERMEDELPQSASGKTVMTTQPKFIPGEGAVTVSPDDHTTVKVRMVDSVGYLIQGAEGTLENGEERMVSTPWSEEDLPFEEAARIGTRRVMQEHATLGVIVTCDGTVSDFPRSHYVSAEESVVSDMKASGKPFVMVLNSADPQSAAAQALKISLEKKYDIPVSLLNVRNMSLADIQTLLMSMLNEFPVREIHFDLPEWMNALDEDHYLIRHILSQVQSLSSSVSKLRDKDQILSVFHDSPYLLSPKENQILPGKGRMSYLLRPGEELFNQILSEQCGTDITNDACLLSLMKDLTHAKKEYDRMAGALKAVSQTGYGLVVPAMSEIKLEKPELMRQGSRWGVRLHASAPTLHLVLSNVETDITPVLGSQEQSEDFVRFLSEEYDTDPEKLWETNFFGKSLQSLVQESLGGKLDRMPADTQEKVQQALSKMLNEGEGGMICILL